MDEPVHIVSIWRLFRRGSWSAFEKSTPDGSSRTETLDVETVKDYSSDGHDDASCSSASFHA